jgi:hypothetical protein
MVCSLHSTSRGLDDVALLAPIHQAGALVAMPAAQLDPVRAAGSPAVTVLEGRVRGALKRPLTGSFPVPPGFHF